MGIRFVSASSQYLLQSSPPAVSYPFTLAFWGRPTTVSNQTWGGFGQSAAGDTDYLLLEIASSQWTITAGSAAGGHSAQGLSSPAPVANRWDFVLGRFISATSRRLSVLTSLGAIGHTQDTTSISPSVNRAALGAYVGGGGALSVHANGHMAEFWRASGDVQPDGLATESWLLHTLAHRGPFAVPGLAVNLVEYHSFRGSRASHVERPKDAWYGAAGRQTWTQGGSPLIGLHPPGNFKPPPSGPESFMTIG